ncbi:cell adhesion molecule Dscam1-like isoform X2 [Tachypleus tridentatus]|uniref:cell adhesion molecule Dscam1-like isoform X2 n=1 Tax=Tachypleus tridentatus TaxID=6853 RepID=UPI003FCEFE4E
MHWIENSHWLIWMCLVTEFATVILVPQYHQGPYFTEEPPSHVDYQNTLGTVIHCAAGGTPKPSIKWTKQDGSDIVDVSGLRQSRSDGSLVFPPFRSQDYKQEVSSTFYRCVASNSVGSIVSRDVQVRAVLNMNYEVRVYDEFVIQGNTAVFKCQIPSFVKDYVIVTSWMRDDGKIFHIGKKKESSHMVLPTGELIIVVGQKDLLLSGKHRYFCQTKHVISGELKRSINGGRLIISEPHNNFPPRIKNSRQQIQVKEGETVHLPCTAEGYPVPSYQWFQQDGSKFRNIQPDERVDIHMGTLMLTPSRVWDTGQYVCVVNNSMGEQRVKTKLLVTAPLSVLILPESIKVQEGQTVVMNCSITGYPVQSIVWLKNQRPLLANNRIRYLTREVLEISPVVREDKGMFQCFVSNEFESAQASKALSLGDDPPGFSSTFSTEILAPDASVSLKCVATGSPLPQITWFLDGAPINENLRFRIGDFVTNDGYVNSFVNITSLRTEDGGIYKCVARNAVAALSHWARLNVYGSPYIKPMNNASVLVGDTFELSCPYAGYPIDSVTWHKGGLSLPQSGRQTVHPNGTLFIQDMEKKTDEGAYICIAANNKGESYSEEINVKVLVPPVISPFVFPPNLREGMRITITCSILDGDLPVRISWLKNNSSLVQQDKVVIENNNEFSSTLFLKEVRFEDKGNYTCLAKNNAASTSYTAEMVVNVPPKWKIAPTDHSVVFGDTVVMDCQAEGFPHPRTWWEISDGSALHNFKTIPSNSHIQTLENGSLVIRDVDVEDSKFYMCQATNGIGAGLTKVVAVKVHVAAHFKRSFQSHIWKKDETAKLQCEAHGESPLQISWSKDNQPINFATNARYEVTEERNEEHGTLTSYMTIHSLNRHDSVIFTCLTKNSFGSDETKIQIIIQEPPDSPTNILATSTGSRIVTLTWSQLYSGNSPVTANKIQYKSSTDSWDESFEILTLQASNTRATITNLRPVTDYHIRIFAKNKLGWSDPSTVVHITTGEEAPEAPPINVRAVAKSSRTIKVTWEPPKPELRNGVLKGYYVGYKIHTSNEPFVYKTVERSQEVVLYNLKRATRYSIKVMSFNGKGSGPSSEELVVETLKNDPPKTPQLKIVAATYTSIKLSWTNTDKQHNIITGYFIYYKKQYGTWEERQTMSDQESYTFRDLFCGSHYHFYLVAYNSAGKGENSDVVAAKTQGNVPKAPKRQAFLSINASSVSIHLTTWQSNGCPINFFVIQYKPHLQSEWILVSNNIVAEQKTVVISDLNSGSWYTLLVTAHNDVGPTEAEYVFSTLTLEGATVPPVSALDVPRPALYKSLSIVVPSGCAIVVLFVIIIVACVVVKRRRHFDSVPGRDNRTRDDKSLEGIGLSVMEGKSSGSIGSGSPKEQLYYPSPYAMSRLPMFPKHLQSCSESDIVHSLRRPGREHIYDVPFPTKVHTDEDVYSHIMETSSIPFPQEINRYQTPKVVFSRPLKSAPRHSRDRQTEECRRPSNKGIHGRQSLASDGHSTDESDSEATTYFFRRNLTSSRQDPQDISETECDRDQNELREKGRTIVNVDGFNIRYEQYS